MPRPLRSELITNDLQRLGLHHGGTDADRAARLLRYYEGHAEDLDLALCTECQRVAAATLACCPFCGEGGDVVEVAAAPAIREHGFDLEDLDRAVAAIRHHTTRAAEEIYETGLILRHVSDSGLWKLRRTPDGLPTYHSLYAWAEAECGIRRAYVNRLRAVADAYSLEQVRAYGVTRLAVALRLPAEERPGFLATTRDVPTRHLAATANAALVPPSAAAARAQGQTSAAAAPPLDWTRAPARRINLPLGLQEVPLYKRPLAEDEAHTPPTPAMSLRDDPWCEVALPDDVLLRLRIVRERDGTLLAQIETREGHARVEAAAWPPEVPHA